MRDRRKAHFQKSLPDALTARGAGAVNISGPHGGGKPARLANPPADPNIQW
jgi:hypothetical protein